MISVRKIEAYLEARKAHEALKQAVKDDGRTPARDRALQDAASQQKVAYARLTGGEIGKVQMLDRAAHATTGGLSP